MAGLKKKTVDRLEEIFRDYTDRQGALITALYAVQEEENHLTFENLNELASIIGMPKSVIYETATFYSLFSFAPRGKHIIRLCRNICCFLNGSDTLLSQVKEILGVEDGETTDDGLYTLEVVECLAACDRAPAMMIDDMVYGPVCGDDLGNILKEYA